MGNGNADICVAKASKHVAKGTTHIIIAVRKQKDTANCRLSKYVRATFKTAIATRKYIASDASANSIAIHVKRAKSGAKGMVTKPVAVEYVANAAAAVIDSVTDKAKVASHASAASADIENKYRVVVTGAEPRADELVNDCCPGGGLGEAAAASGDGVVVRGQKSSGNNTARVRHTPVTKHAAMCANEKAPVARDIQRVKVAQLW